MIELGRGLPPLDEPLRTDDAKVAGSARQVWLRASGMTSEYGLAAILIALCAGRSATDILEADAMALFERLGLKEHLTPQ